MKRLTLLVLLLVAALPLMAQDMIVRRDGSVVQAKILEVSSSEIKYKKFAKPDGPLFVLKTSEIISINYEDGEVERYDQVAEPAPQAAPQAATAPKGTPEEPLFIEVGPDANNPRLLEKYNWPRVRSLKNGASGRAVQKYHYKFGFTKNSVLSSADLEIAFERGEWYALYSNTTPSFEYSIKITNKTDRTIYIDLSKSFRINPDGSSRTYYDGSKQTSVTNAGSTGIGIHLGHGISIGGGGTSATTTTYTNERFLVIPPHSNGYLATLKRTDNTIIAHGEEFYRGAIRYTLPREVMKGEVRNYSESDSPGFIRYTITYSKEPDFSTYSELEMNLFIQQVLGLGYYEMQYDHDNCIIGFMAY